MSMNNNCTCGMQPCSCDLSITTSNCCVDMCVSVPTCPTTPPTTPPVVTPPAIDLKDFLKLLELKCDKATCKLLSEEMALLYLLLDLDMDNINPIVPGGVVQKITNMVFNLKGDLTGKYPSAILLKEELVKLWKCLSNKLQHHGEWKDNWSYRDIKLLPGGNCAFEHGKDPAPGKIKVITPVDVGSTVFHDIEGKHCLFESLVNNNITEPSKLAVLEGKWMSYCDLKEVVNCVLPRKIITNCKDKCDDPNGDGVHEDLTLCKRVSNLEACVLCTVIDTNTIDLTKARLPDNGSTIKPSQVGNSIKADVIIDPKACNGLVATAHGLYVEASPLEVEDTDTVDMTLTKDGCKDKIKADVKHQNTPCITLSSDSKGLKAATVIDANPKNIIKCGAHGLMAQARMYCHKIKLDTNKHETVPTHNVPSPGSWDGKRVLASSSAAPETGDYFVAGSYSAEVNITGTPCDQVTLAVVDPRISFEVGGHAVGPGTILVGSTTNATLEPKIRQATGFGFIVHLTKGQKIDMKVEMWRHTGSHCTVYHDIYLEGQYCEVK